MVSAASVELSARSLVRREGGDASGSFFPLGASRVLQLGARPVGRHAIGSRNLGRLM